MNTTSLLAILLTLLLGLAPQARAQSTAFTYQGQLKDTGSPVTGNYTLRFALFSAPNGGNQFGATLTNSTVPITNGLFTVGLDFGPGIFNGADRYLEISVGAVTLQPRVFVSSTPSALYAQTAGTATNISGMVPSGALSGIYSGPITLNNGANQLIGSFSGNGGGLTNLNAATIGGLGASNFWHLNGNTATIPGTQFLGTTDNQPFILKVNNAQALRLEPALSGGTIFPNVIFGAFSAIQSGESASVIAGGREHSIQATTAAISGGWRHRILVGASDSIIGGGQNNVISNNSISATISGGTIQVVGQNAQYATLGGGRHNQIGDNAINATISGGRDNVIGTNSSNATIIGGTNNVIGSLSGGSTISGGLQNKIGDFSLYAVISGGYQNIMQPYSSEATIGGGAQNLISTFAYFTTIAGGLNNEVQFDAAACTISGGQANIIQPDSLSCTISGGQQNAISNASYFATIAGGDQNLAAGTNSFAAGHRAQALHAGAFVWADATDVDYASTKTNQFAIRATGGVVLSDNTPAISFGTTTRQMLNLWGTQYGIGVQNGATYFRTDSGMAYYWFGGGVHSDVTGNAGAGGAVMMRLGSNGLTVNGTFVSVSDRAAKANFQPVSASDALAKVAALPITSWNYTNSPATRHIGPMAQDFYAAFGTGEDDRHIATIDESGVALAAIQGLNQKLEAKDAEIHSLQARLADLEKLVSKIATKN
ncbi:MAG: hypothetical protein JWR69_859 [Pedosphaera sp.]|nr:hypothetical protein [Pedosphaera sp.]